MVVNVGAIACRGFSNATTIIRSQELGQNHLEAAKGYGKRMLYITIAVALAGCAIIIAIRPFIIDFYSDKLSPDCTFLPWKHNAYDYMAPYRRGHKHLPYLWLFPAVAVMRNSV